MGSENPISRQQHNPTIDPTANAPKFNRKQSSDRSGGGAANQMRANARFAMARSRWSLTLPRS
jgi:hypothetical protein